MKGVNTAPSTNIEQRTPDPGDRSDTMGVTVTVISRSVVISGDGWFYDFGDSNRAFKRDCTVYTGY